MKKHHRFLGLPLFSSVAAIVVVCWPLRADDLPSDRRLKTSVAPIDSALWKISTIQGVTFYWDTVTFRDHRSSRGRQVGIIAQEVEEVFPELVQTDSSGFKSLSYDRLSAILLEALKDQHKTIRKQDLDIQFLLEQNEKLRKRVEALEMK